MSGRKRYRRYAAAMLLLGAMAFLYGGWLLLRGQIPDSIQAAKADEIPSFFSSPIDRLIEKEIQFEETSGTSPAPEGFAASVSTGNVKNRYQISYKLLGKIPLKTVNVEVVDREQVYVGGLPIGIYLETKGVLVVGTGTVQSIQGKSCIPAENVVLEGDYITAANGSPLKNKEELIACINESGGNAIALEVQRSGKLLHLEVTPVQTGENEYKAGIWVRNDTQGIGTLTSTDPSAVANLMYTVYKREGDNFKVISSRFGRQTFCAGKIKALLDLGAVNGVVLDGDAIKCSWEMEDEAAEEIGEIKENTGQGIYGTVTAFPHLASELSLCEIGYRQEAEEGPAVVVSMVDGVRKEFEVEIQELRYHVKEENKGMVLKVTDEELLKLTGGIVQGMSGSPILQNGRLIGAVTHVFVNDPTKGYGIFIEDMLDH